MHRIGRTGRVGNLGKYPFYFFKDCFKYVNVKPLFLIQVLNIFFFSGS